jgi:hypothetical protein
MPINLSCARRNARKTDACRRIIGRHFERWGIGMNLPGACRNFDFIEVGVAVRCGVNFRTTAPVLAVSSRMGRHPKPYIRAAFPNALPPRPLYPRQLADLLHRASGVGAQIKGVRSDNQSKPLCRGTSRDLSPKVRPFIDELLTAWRPEPPWDRQ